MTNITEFTLLALVVFFFAFPLLAERSRRILRRQSSQEQYLREMLSKEYLGEDSDKTSASETQTEQK